jgi:hypothetical protein
MMPWVHLHPEDFTGRSAPNPVLSALNTPACANCRLLITAVLREPRYGPQLEGYTIPYTSLRLRFSVFYNRYGAGLLSHQAAQGP